MTPGACGGTPTTRRRARRSRFAPATSTSTARKAAGDSGGFWGALRRLGLNLPPQRRVDALPSPRLDRLSAHAALVGLHRSVAMDVDSGPHAGDQALRARHFEPRQDSLVGLKPPDLGVDGLPRSVVG